MREEGKKKVEEERRRVRREKLLLEKAKREASSTPGKSKFYFLFLMVRMLIKMVNRSEWPKYRKEWLITSPQLINVQLVSDVKMFYDQYCEEKREGDQNGQKV